VIGAVSEKLIKQEAVGGMNLHAIEARCLRVRGVRAEQELALGAAAGDQVELARKHRSGKHALAPDQDLGLSHRGRAGRLCASRPSAAVPGRRRARC
jgi:hypothetical protein